MPTKQLKTVVPDVCIDPELNKYDGQVLFPEQVAKANALLKKAGVPKPKSATQEAE